MSAVCRIAANATALALALNAASAAAQTILENDLCDLLEAHTPADSESCLANRSWNPSDNSFVVVARAGTDQSVFLLRSDLAAGGDCRPTEGLFSSYQCVTLDFDTPPDFDAICDFSEAPYSCDDNRSGHHYNASSNQVAPGPGGVNAGPSERLFVAARGLEAGDASVQETGNVLIYRGQPGPESVSLRLSRPGEVSPTMQVRPPVNTLAALKEVLARIEAEGVPWNNLIALGTDGRFVARTAGTLTYYGTPDDCDGACATRELLTQALFDARLAMLGATVPLETNAPGLRDALIDRLLLGSVPFAPVDDVLDGARIRQPAGFLILNWN